MAFPGKGWAVAVDLPGFGDSLRSDRVYNPRLMTDALHTVAAQIRQRCGTAAPLDALALSLSCEFLARAASDAQLLADACAALARQTFATIHPELPTDAILDVAVERPASGLVSQTGEMPWPSSPRSRAALPRCRLLT